MRTKHYYPITIFKTRYGGTYEGGKWAAIRLHPHEVPPAAMGSDLTCVQWWDDFRHGIGVGPTETEALAALMKLETPITMIYDPDRKINYLAPKDWWTG